MQFNEDFQKLKTAIYYLEKQDRDNLISFLNGFFLSKTDRIIEKIISTYLCEEYEINIEFNSIIEQIDHFSFLRNKDWYSGYFELINLIKPEKYPICSKEEEFNNLKNNRKGEEYQHIKINDSDSFLSAGDFIQLGDALGSEYKKTKFFDKQIRNPSWELFYPSERDFNFVNFYHNDENLLFGKTRSLFSGSISRINEISLEDGKYFLYTDLFKIEFEKGLMSKEFLILEEVPREYDPFYSGLLEDINIYIEGMSEYTTISKIINLWCFQNLHLFNKKWQKYNRGISGNWCHIK